ncbi:MAG: type phosphodiesterase/nucleotide pyrophosphatase [Acidobacteriales bacterium]|nr:type phosphodiesterase/nucleotide pyrophosphatase [Terriglobales bacterium]
MKSFHWEKISLFSFIALTFILGSAWGQSKKPAVGEKKGAPANSIKHIVLLGIDGFHALDLENFVTSHPQSALAELKKISITYTGAHTTKPSDSFPGILSMVTGGTPFSTGVYFESSYDRALSPAGSKCATTGTKILLDESIDINPDANDGGGGVSAEKVPLDPKRGCAPVFPHDLLRVNTIFEVIKAAGYRTAWADKQPGYEVVNGPSGKGVDDLFTPELHFNASSKSIEKIKAFDDLRLQAVLNEISGHDKTGKQTVQVPAMLGMTFQAVTVGQKLKSGMGYSDIAGTPSAPLLDAMEYTDRSIGKIMEALRSRQLLSSTVVILTAKHGQSPIDITKKQIIDEKIIPNLINGIENGLVAQASGADIVFIWLTDSKRTAEVVATLKAHEKEAHIERILSGKALQLMFPDAAEDSRAPDIVVEPEFGVIYTKPNGLAIAEHGGFLDEDTHVPLMLAIPGHRPQEVRTAVTTTQIAPTILSLLGLDPNKLKAVQIEKTQTLPYRL